MRRISRRWSRRRRRSTARSKTSAKPAAKCSSASASSCAQRRRARRAVAVQEADARPVDEDRRGDVVRSSRASQERVARRLRAVDVGHEPGLAAAQQLALEQRVVEPHAARRAGAASVCAAAVRVARRTCSASTTSVPFSIRLSTHAVEVRARRRPRPGARSMISLAAGVGERSTARDALERRSRAMAPRRRARGGQRSSASSGRRRGPRWRDRRRTSPRCPPSAGHARARRRFGVPISSR